MNQLIALPLDVLLWALIALTAFLILSKTRQLYFLAGTKALEQEGASDEDLAPAMESLESGMALLAALASGAAFVGLAGTVLHIISALGSLKGASLDISVISGPIATALYATLLGLTSAIPAAAAYNLFLRRLQLIESRAARAWALRQCSDKSASAPYLV